MNSFQKLLPSHSQIREDEDPDELPRFGATEENIADNIVMLEPEPDEIDKNVERLLGPAPIKKAAPDTASKEKTKPESKSPEPDDQPSLPINDDSFSNLQMAAEAPKGGIENGERGEDEEGQASLKVSMIHPNDDGADNSFFQN